MAANPIPYSEIEAWARLADTRPTPWEVSVLTRLDDAVLALAGKDKAEPVSEDPDGVVALLSSFGTPTK